MVVARKECTSASTVAGLTIVWSRAVLSRIGANLPSRGIGHTHVIYFTQQSRRFHEAFV